jgi:glycosyltransferase involved in cell wall biosynthesis
MMSSLVLSVVIPITERAAELADVVDEYVAAVESCGLSYEVVFVQDQRNDTAARVIDARTAEGRHFRNIKLARSYGDSTALATGLKVSMGEKILILPPYSQIEAVEIPRLISMLDEYDFVVAERDRAGDSWINRLQAGAYNYLANKASDLTITDTTCEVRAMRRQVADEVDVYGDMHRFFPHLANRVGFSVVSVRVAQSARDRRSKIYRPGIYVRRLLDVLSALFVLRFTKKPLRFFGLIGGTIMLTGTAIMLLLAVQWLFFGVALAERPALFVGSLAIVLGLQIVAIGLVGETVIFTHAKHLPEYHVREIVENPELGSDAEDGEAPQPRVRETS